MSAGGHIMDMLNRIRQNAALKVSRRNKFKGNNRKINFSKKEQSKPEYDFSKVSKVELESIKNKIKEDARIEHKKQYLFWVLLIIFSSILFLLFNYFA